MTKPHLHIHSDSNTFAGCENMLVNFFQSSCLHQSFRLTFSYRYSKAYEDGYHTRVTAPIHRIPLWLYYLSDQAFERFGSTATFAWKILSLLFLLPVWVLIWNTAVLYRAFGRDPIDVLHVNNGGYPGGSSCLAAVFAAWLRGVRRIVMVVNNEAVSYARPSRWLGYPFDRLLRTLPVQFVTGSRFTGNLLKQVLDLPEDRVMTIPNGIFPRPLTETPEQVCTRLNLHVPQGRCLMGIVAVLDPRKGHRFLLDALALVKRRLPPERWPVVIIVGDGPERQNLHQQARNLDLETMVSFFDYDFQIFNIYQTIDVLLLSSIGNEDFPNVILEAMCQGKPVIGTRVAGVPEQIVDRETGLVIPPRDPEAMAAAIQFLAENPETRLEMGKAGAARFRQLYFWEIAVARYGDLFKTLLKNP